MKVGPNIPFPDHYSATPFSLLTVCQAGPHVRRSRRSGKPYVTPGAQPTYVRSPGQMLSNSSCVRFVLVYQPCTFKTSSQDLILLPYYPFFIHDIEISLPQSQSEVNSMCFPKKFYNHAKRSVQSSCKTCKAICHLKEEIQTFLASYNAHPKFAWWGPSLETSYR